MTKTFASRLAVFASGLLISFSAFAAGGGATLQAGNDLSDRASLQRGAQLYMNYCAGCHSLKYMRYSRMAEDLGLTEDEVMKNLNFTGAKFGEQVQVSMPAAGGEKWFGKMPPDLSVISRVRGSDWIYTYLKSFYLDESRPLGWNNKLFPNASMPNPLWELQGLQHAEFGPVDPATGERHVEGLKVAQAGRQSAQEFDQTARDITNFLEYVGEPAALKRQSVGVWVILFLAALTFLAYLLKQEYWKDVH
ncbi:cytochrome c1 [Pseudoxanthomonas sp. F11]|jgi:ubiquinol-cytochrome c reductase cytochrome c1 subunit|uniref:Cytochrome c1 n=1 Tax=Pseudoxanthomonas mexicana TaxID=128785 RepID=A0A7G6URV7_PSEMX|nr:MULTISPECIES: cytochrome c1 [Pseudoxanthomonas]MCA0298916.1 cytochrome c1 [Pseudomonadota bacterium]KAF1724524.1 cytochrome c1 [Pseudoxanthomonas mexicana]MBP7599240.1 cytochrome c1 [Pseudoxanthomonas sp.]MCH2090202.1 cytochrome c1 [Pseudoxanthomonas sp.]MCP1583328.1 ubiquinol-cytochrome c reductase cytochrome c1 subunit [Pseudoxanthomonas mexicana]